MDDRGRLAQPLKGIARWRWLSADRAALRAVRGAGAVTHETEVPFHRSSWTGWSSLVNARWPRGIGTAGTVAVILASLAYGAVKGDHIPTVVDGVQGRARRRRQCRRLPHRVGRAGRPASRQPRGGARRRRRHRARRRCCFSTSSRRASGSRANPWIADATVLKLYPGELQIGIREREAFALWQKDGRVSVIADDGTVLEPYVAPAPDRAAAGGRTRRRDARKGISRAARPLSRPARLRARLGPGGRAALEPAAEERHRRAAAGNRHRAPRSSGWSRSTARRT